MVPACFGFWYRESPLTRSASSRPRPAAASRWPKASPLRVARALTAHGAIGLAISALLYVLCVTGSLAVFQAEWQRWEQPAVSEFATVSPAAAERAARAMLARDPRPTDHLYLNLPTPDIPRLVVTTDHDAWVADASGALVAPEAHPWTQFLLDLHYYLTLPHTAGLIVVGILGVLLLAASLSGFLAHPRIFRDAFVWRRGSGRAAEADLHNRLSVWTAPFHLPVALTGAMLGLSTVLAIALGAAFFDGGPRAVFDPIFGAEPAGDDRPADLAAIAAPLGHMAEAHPDLTVAHVIVHDPATAGQHTAIIARHADRLIFGEYYLFDADGRFTGTVGLADGTVGQQVAASVYQVHFGSFGGLPVKLAYGIFGVALCWIVASGMTLYFTKRARRGRPAPRLERAWTGVVWGTPGALGITLVARLVGLTDAAGLVGLFWVALAVAVIAAVCLNARARAARWGRVWAGGLPILAILLHALRHGGAAAEPLALGVSAAGVLAALATWRSLALRLVKS
ncbi:hypothetical protein CCR80_04090 [Rhodothalassium salexigens]|nr:hypothetical protein [Rhodothalassium salexigens]